MKHLLEIKTKNFRAGRLQDHIEKWLQITSDENILSLITGTKLEFIPNSEMIYKYAHDCSIFMNEQEKVIINEEIKSLLEKKVIEKSTHEKGEYVSGIFTREKSDGSHRMILNLKEFNQNIEYKKFKMETFKTALNLIRQNCWMASIDLVSAYYCVPIDKQDRKYLKFLWEGQLYEYSCYSNGLAQCPRNFTKLTKPIYSHLHGLGHIITGYLDDSLLIAEDQTSCLANIADTIKLFDQLGFIVHANKSILKPTQEITYLGFVINSKEMSVKLTDKRKDSLLNFCTEIASKRFNKIRDVARLIGLMVSSFPAVPLGPLHYRQLELEKSIALKSSKNNWDNYMKLSEKALDEIKWWKLNTAESKQPIIRVNPQLIIKTDASLTAWGAVCNNVRTSGAWSKRERERKHINELEMLAAFFGLKSFTKHLTNIHVQIYIDNNAAMACINKMGSSKSKELNSLTKEIWAWCQKRNIWLSAARIAGSDNIEADYESRHVNLDGEWKLDSELLQCALYILNFKPDMDLFASRLNCQTNKFMSWKPDPEATGIDAFTINWETCSFYAFPPFSLISRVLQKIRTDTARGIIVVPYWPTQAFFPLLLRLLVANPVLLSARKHLLTLPGYPEMQHPMNKKLRILICKVSGKDIENKAFQNKLPKLSWQLGGQTQNEFITHTLKSGKGMQIESKWIQFHHQ